MKNKTWTLCCLAVIIIAALTLTPLVIPIETFKPEFLGMPYTLWMGIAVSLLLWLITYIGILVHPGKHD
jgi:uncharacterized membrane protein